MRTVNPSVANPPAAAAGSCATQARCVGIVIAVPEPMATHLQHARASFGDPMASVVPAHITLVTTTEAEDWDAAVRHVREVTSRQQAFRITLRGTDSFRPVSPVVFLRVEDGFEECTSLHKELQTGPLARDLAFPYHPHVTVAHDVSEEGMDSAVERLRDYETSFTVTSVGLYEHDPSGIWRLREEMPLGG